MKLDSKGFFSKILPAMAAILVVLFLFGRYKNYFKSGIVGGDLNISFSGSHWTPCIDAHPRKSGDFQYEVEIQDKKVYLTKEGKKKFDDILKTGYTPSLFKDTAGGMFSLPTRRQSFIGRP